MSNNDKHIYQSAMKPRHSVSVIDNHDNCKIINFVVDLISLPS